MTREITYTAPVQYQPVHQYQPTQNSNGYSSVFDDPAKFEHCYRMAQILADSCFVPETRGDIKNSFRGNSNNCLIALDLAGRLGLAPTALFPHLYLIGGRPALSAQFVIALVNRSGKFSRIQWEEGVDGEVVYDNYGKQSRDPNYYAIAYFTDLATGDVLRSTRIDVELARRSGWLGKSESKWKTMPKEMCRWRSAAWLCKNYAPELIMGLEFEDEIKDQQTAERASVSNIARSVSATIVDAEPITGSTSEDPEDVEKELSNLLYEARTLAELNEAASQIGASNASPTVKSRLRLTYKSRREELASVTQEPELEREPAETPKPKPTRKRAAKKEPEPAPEVENVSYEDAIKQAPSLEDLSVLANSIQTTYDSGALDDATYKNLFKLLDLRERALSSDAPTSAPPTERQIKNAQVILDGIKEANDPDKLQRAREAISDARERSLITNDQANELFDAVQDVAGGLLF